MAGKEVGMQRILVTWAPDSVEVRRFADELKATVEGPDAQVRCRPAASTSITDIAAADVVFFGVGRSDAEVPADYADLVRIFGGANLAGKAAACFSAGGARASAALVRHLRSSGLSVLEEEPPLAERTGRVELRAWAGRARAQTPGQADGRR